MVRVASARGGRLEPTRARDPTVSGQAWALIAVASAVVITLEMVRVLFTVGYHLADRVGWVPGGAVVVATFATPILLGPWQRLSRGAGLPIMAGAALAARLWMQSVHPVPYWLAAVGTGAGLMVIAQMVSALRPFVFAVGMVAGLALDTTIRALGRTWDIPWRDDASAWLLTAVLLGVFALGIVVEQRRRPSRWHSFEGASALGAVLLGPFLYLACFYTQSPAYLASAGGVPLAAGVAVALGDAILAMMALAIGAGWKLHGRPAGVREWMARHSVIGGLILVVVGAFLPTTTGGLAIALAIVVQVVAAAVYGVVLRDGSAECPAWKLPALAGGGFLLFGLLALLYQVSFLVKLPFPSRAVPAVGGALFVLVQLARVRPPQLSSGLPIAVRSMGAMTVLAAAVPFLLVVSLPNLVTRSVPGGPVSVMTFNINQAVRDGQLNLAEIASVVRASKPDVVVLEEVGRGMAVSGMTDEAEWLRWKLQLPYVWAPAGDNQFGNLILTRMPVLARDVLALGKGAGTQERSAALVRLDLGEGRDLLVIGAHLQNGSATAIHQTRAGEYRAIIQHWGGRDRTVLAGDLNTYPGWGELAQLRDAGFWTTQSTTACTMPTSNRNCPDWIFVSRDLTISEVHVTVDRPDHRPLIATVTAETAEANR